jgi:FtsZ-binding cell division protein ZapB
MEIKDKLLKNNYLQFTENNKKENIMTEYLVNFEFDRLKGIIKDLENKQKDLLNKISELEKENSNLRKELYNTDYYNLYQQSLDVIRELHCDNEWLYSEINDRISDRNK